MTTNEMIQKLNELKELERMQEELSAEIESLKDDLKAEMTSKGLTKMTVGVYKLSYSNVSSTRVDTKSLKIDLTEIADKYSKVTESKRFTVNV